MINTSRGEIIDTNALIEGLENVIKNRDLLILKAYPNVMETYSICSKVLYIKGNK